jgi:hypothetical protein
MKNVLFVSCLFLTLGLVSCNKEAKTEKADASLIRFSLGGEFAAMTKGASEVTTGNLSSIYVNATTGTSGAEVTTAPGFANVVFSKSGDNFVANQYWPNSNPSYHFYASNVSLTHGASGATVSPADASTDIVVGYIASPTYKSSNSFTLDHIFAQVGTCQMNAPENYAVNGLKISLQPIISGTYNLQSGSWTSKGAAGAATYIFGTAGAGVNIAANGNSTSADNDLWLVPGTYQLTATYTETRGDFTSDTITQVCNVDIQQGKNNNIVGKVTADLATGIVFSVVVTPWGVNNIGAGDPVSFNDPS